MAVHDNRRIKKHIDSQSPGSPDGIDRYEHLFYAGVQLVETRNTTTQGDQPESLQPKYQWIWSPRYVDAPILRDENTDQDSLCDDARIYYLADANHNVTSLVDTAGDALERYIFDPYGRVTIYNADWTANPQSPIPNPCLYTGRHLEAETGLYYYRARYYSAELGRFLARDPIGYDNGMNFYWYCGNGPLIHVDPHGKYFFCLGLSAGVTAVVPISPSLTAVGVSASAAGYYCAGWSRAKRWHCGPCVAVTFTNNFGVGLFIGAGLGPAVMFNVQPGSVNPSEGMSIQVGAGGGLAAGPVGGPAGVAVEITVDVDISSGDRSIAIPHLGPAAGGYVAFRFSGACTACAPNIPLKLAKCFFRVAAAVTGAINRINGLAIGDGRPQTITIKGEPMDAGGIPELGGASL